MSYIINNSRGNIVAVVDDGTVNTTATDLALIGRAVVNYGEYQNENYVYLLENFANGSAPLQPVLGQLWYNSTTDTISAYSTENTWTALASQTYVDAQKVSPVFTGVPTAPTASDLTNTTQLATTAFVQNNKISPAFTGTPTAPTASNGTSTTQIATTAYVQNQLSSTSGITTVGTITGGNLVTGGLVSAVGNITGGNITTAGLITVGGNLLSSGLVSVTGNIIGGNLNTFGEVSATGNVIGANFIGNVIPPAGGAVSTSGNVTGGNILTSGLISATGNITGANFIGNVIPPAGGAVSTTGNVTGGNIDTAGQISAAGNITGNNLSVGNGTVTLNNIVNSGANATGNIGSSTSYFNQVFATSTTALYADLAEYYRADAEYSPGTVLVFGGNNEVTLCEVANDVRVAGVVTTQPAYVMNAKLSGKFTVAVALQGRVPVQVLGPVSKGDLMVAGINGHTQANNQARAGTILGKSLENFDGATGIIEIAVGRG